MAEKRTADGLLQCNLLLCSASFHFIFILSFHFIFFNVFINFFNTFIMWPHYTIVYINTFVFTTKLLLFSTHFYNSTLILKPWRLRHRQRRCHHIIQSCDLSMVLFIMYTGMSSHDLVMWPLHGHMIQSCDHDHMIQSCDLHEVCRNIITWPVMWPLQGTLGSYSSLSVTLTNTYFTIPQVYIHTHYWER